MNAPPSKPIAFRLPWAVVWRTFILHAAVLVAVLAAFHVLSRDSSFAALGGAAALLLLVLAFGYAATARRVWVTLSAAGVSSVSHLGRRVELPWSASVNVVASRRSGYKGHAVVEQGAGALPFSASAIFIPAAIASSQEFASKVAAWAPAGHPLRSITRNAA
jgi:hypothetical protein